MRSHLLIDRRTEVKLKIVVCVAFLLGIALVNFNGCLSYLWTLLLFLLTNFFCDKSYRDKNFIAFHFFLLLAILMYLFHAYRIPYNHGLTGGVGITDDTAYYMAAKDGGVLVGEVSGHASRQTWFVKIIRFLHPFPIVDPINLIILNVFIGLTFLPYFTAKLSDFFFHDSRISKKTFYLSLFCPFYLQGGLIIMRDVPGLVLILAAMFFFLKRRYFFSVVMMALLFLLKMGFIVFLFVPMACYLFYYKAQNEKRWYTIGVGLLVLLFYIFILPNLSKFTDGRLNDGELFRTSFAEGFLYRNNEESLLVRIYRYPVVIRIPLLVVAFLTIPMLKFNFGYIDGFGFVPRYVLMIGLFPLYIMVFSKYLFNVVQMQGKDRIVKMLLLIIFFQALALGMVSLQVRHKVVLLPFIYMLIAYGMVNVPTSKKGRLCQIAFVLMNVGYALMKI